MLDFVLIVNLRTIAPARKALKPERSLWMNEVTDGNVYRGKPRPELDAAWDELVLYSNLKLTAEDLKKINRTSVRLSDASGQLTDYYWSGLNVHHQIHCLKLVRQALYPDYYFKGNVKLKRHLEDHIDHCVDSKTFLKHSISNHDYFANSQTSAWLSCVKQTSQLAHMTGSITIDGH